MLIHDAVLEAARRHPDATAFGGDEITYGELERVVLGLAARLREEAGSGRVAIVAPKSPAAVMGMLATLTAGLAYVPIDSRALPELSRCRNVQNRLPTYDTRVATTVDTALTVTGLPWSTSVWKSSRLNTTTSTTNAMPPTTPNFASSCSR